MTPRLGRLGNHSTTLSSLNKFDFDFFPYFRHHIEATRNMQNYHRLFYASQERYDKLMNLSSSGGAAGLRTVEASEGSDTVFDGANALTDLHLSKNGFDKSEDAEHIHQVDSGIDIGDVQTANSVGSLTGSPEQNVGLKGFGSLSPGSYQRQRMLKPVIDKSSKGTVDRSTTGAKERERASSFGKNGQEKASNSRAILERANSNPSSSNSHVFAVPKPPGPRKGPRKQLHVEFAVGSKAGTSNGVNPSPVTSPGILPSGPSEVSSRRTQSRFLSFHNSIPCGFKVIYFAGKIQCGVKPSFT